MASEIQEAWEAGFAECDDLFRGLGHSSAQLFKSYWEMDEEAGKTGGLEHSRLRGCQHAIHLAASDAVKAEKATPVPEPPAEEEPYDWWAIEKVPVPPGGWPQYDPEPVVEPPPEETKVGFLDDLMGAVGAIADVTLPVLQDLGITKAPPRPYATTYTLPGGARPVQTAGAIPAVWQYPPAGTPRPGAAVPAPWRFTQMQLPSVSPAMGQIFGQEEPYMAYEQLPALTGDQQAAAIAAITSPWGASACGARAKIFARPNPTTGTITWFKPAGRPLLFSSDLTSAKRVRKLARRAKRAGG